MGVILFHFFLGQFLKDGIQLGVGNIKACHRIHQLLVGPDLTGILQLSGKLCQFLGVGIIMGQMLGSGAKEADVRDTNRKLIFTSCMTGLVFGRLMAAISGKRQGCPGSWETASATTWIDRSTG